MNRLLSTLFLFVIASGCIAQTNSTPPAKLVSQANSTTQLSIGGEFGFPTGQASQVYGAVVGGSLKLEVPVAKTPLSLVFTGGISDFLLQYTYKGVFDNATYLTLEGGGKYYFGRIGYIEGDLGISDNANGNYSTSRAALVYAPVIGFTAPTTKHKAKIDIGLRYEGRVESGGTIGQIALRVAYKFGI